MSAAYEVERDIMARLRQSETTKQKVPPITYIPGDFAYLASVYPLSAFEGGGQFNTPPMPPCEHELRDVRRDPQKFPPAILKIQGAFLPLDRGGDDIKPEQTPAIDQVRDWARRYADLGVFVPADPTNPKSVTKAQVEEAIKKLEVRYGWAYEQCEEAWRDHGTLVKWGVAKIGYLAAKYFGREPVWAQRVGEQDQCRFCHKAIPSDIWKCPECLAVLDWALAYEAGFCTEEERDKRLAAAKGRKKTQEEEF